MVLCLLISGRKGQGPVWGNACKPLLRHAQILMGDGFISAYGWAKGGKAPLLLPTHTLGGGMVSYLLMGRRKGQGPVWGNACKPLLRHTQILVRGMVLCLLISGRKGQGPVWGNACKPLLRHDCAWGREIICRGRGGPQATPAEPGYAPDGASAARRAAGPAARLPFFADPAACSLPAFPFSGSIPVPPGGVAVIQRHGQPRQRRLQLLG